MNIQLSENINKSSNFILPFFKDAVDFDKIKELTGITNLEFTGKYKEIISTLGQVGNHIHLVGIGEEKDLPKLTALFTHLSFKNQKAWKGNVQLDASTLSADQLEQAVTGLGMGTYEIGRYKKQQEEKTPQLETVTIVGNSDKQAAEQGVEASKTINDIKHLVDAPANVKTPAYLAQWAKASAEKYGYACEIFDEKQMQEIGFHAALSVGKASQYPPRIIIVKHLPNADQPVDMVLVGKGVTFDTGGISIKPSNNMHYMKSDMGGAAAVLGTVELLAKRGSKKNVIGIVGAAENAVDALSYLPGDIIDSYSGKTIEVINTDAEGRLVLADCLNYAVKNFEPRQMIDLATLTGSAVRALGYSSAALFTKNEDMKNGLTKAGNALHECVWQMPLYDEFADDLHSDVADISNLGATPVAGAITAAKFLEAFTEKHEAWAHLDIAGVAFGNTDNAKMKSSTGFGVRLLTQYIEEL